MSVLQPDLGVTEGPQSQPGHKAGCTLTVLRSQPWSGSWAEEEQLHPCIPSLSFLPISPRNVV